MPLSATASSAAHIPNTLKRSMRLIDFGSMRFSGSRFRTSPAKVTLHSGVGVKLLIGPIPDRPSTSDFQNSGTVFPTSVTAPRPVMTTRRRVIVRMGVEWGIRGRNALRPPTREGGGAGAQGSQRARPRVTSCPWPASGRE